MLISYHCIWYCSQAVQNSPSLLTLEMCNYRLSTEPFCRPLEVNAKCPCASGVQEAREESFSIYLTSLFPLPAVLEVVISHIDSLVVKYQHQH